MAGGASVNVQIKSGTNTLHGSAFEYFSHAGMRSRNYFLPADQEKTKDNKNVFGGTVGGPIKRDKVFYFVSLENTMQRTIGGPYVTQATGSASQFLSMPTAAIRSGNFTGTGMVIYDPATGNNLGQGRVPFAFANCGLTSTADPRFDSCNFIPAARINQVSKNILSHLPLPQLAGQREQLLRGAEIQHGFLQAGYEGLLERDQPHQHERPVQLPAGERAGRRPVWRRWRREPARRSARCSIPTSAARPYRSRTSCRPNVRDRRSVRIHAAAHLPAAPGRSRHVLGIGRGHPQRVSAAAPARLGHAPGRHRLAVVELVRERHPRQRQHGARCSTTSTRSGSR